MWPVVLFFGFPVVGALFALWELRRWASIWHTTPAELARDWPGDELSPRATEVTTRAVTIQAPAEAVWAWLVQIGQDRAGFYSYTWLENLFRCVMPRVEQIVPEWQERTLGDIVFWRAGPDGGGTSEGVRIDRGQCCRSRHLRLGATRRQRRAPVDTGRYPVPVSGTATGSSPLRALSSDFSRRLFWYGVPPAHFIMEGRCAGIRQLAEANPPWQFTAS